MLTERFIFLAVVVFIISGCATVTEGTDIGVQRSQDRITYLEGELKKQQEKNLSLRKALKQAQDEIKIITQQYQAAKSNIKVRMPSAKEIQAALKNAGAYNGDIDGIIGQKTKEAIRRFQKANGLNPDGVVGSKTWEILVKYLQAKE
jgi:murein L,D-transpeptidase YcbB/YkuD